MSFKKFKKLLASVLAASMIIGVVPANVIPVQAAEEKEVVDTALVFTDLHAMDNGDSLTGTKGYKKGLVTSLMTTLKNAGYNFSSVTSGGDVFSSNSTTNTGYTDTITGYINSVFADAEVSYVWSDHDRGALNNATEKKALDKTSHLTYGAGPDGTYGTDDDANYYVYALSMGDICSYDRYKAGFNELSRKNSGFTATITQAIKNFESDVATLKKDRPLFIVSHQPLFDRRNDNAFAEAWFDSINEVAKTMDVAFFFGHNHKYDEYSDYYYAKGSTMPVATDEGWQGYETGAGYQGYLPTGDLQPVEKQLNFTHMCAGYTDPGTQTSTTREGTVMAITIYEDSINYCTYDKNGKYTNSKMGVDATVTRDHAASNAPEVPEDTTTVPEGYTLDRIEVVNQGVTKYYLGEALNKEGLSVVAVYQKEDAADVRINIKEATDAEEGYTVSGYDANKAGKQCITVSYERCIGRFAVEVFKKTFVNDTGDVTVDFTNYGITSMKATSTAKTVERYKAYVTYDITPTGYTQGDEATVTVKVDTNLFDTTIPVNVLDKGKCIATTNIVDGKVTFTTNHFSEYDVVQASIEGATWIEIPGGVVYTLVGKNYTISTNKEYLIASAGSGDVSLLTNDGSENAASTLVKVNQSKITLTDDSKVAWTFSHSTTGTISNGSKYIYLSSNNSGGTNFISSESRDLVIKQQPGGEYRIYRDRRTDYYLRYNNNLWQNSTTASNVYLFEKEPVTSIGGYVTLVGQNVFTVNMGTMTVAQIEEMIRSNIHVYTATDKSGNGAVEQTDYTIEGTVNPAVAGEYPVTVKYGTTTLGTITVNVVDKVAESISVNPTTFTIERDTAANTVIGTITVKYSATETEEVPLTIEMLSGTFNREKNGTYSNLSVSYGGKRVGGLTLKVVNKTGVEDFPKYPNPGSVDLNKTAKGDDFQNTGIARVELSTSGLPSSKGVDIIVMLDMSSSMTRCIAHDSKTCNVADCKTREEELEDAMLQFEAALKASKNASNIRVAVADFNGFYSGTSPYARENDDRMSDASTLNNNNAFNGNAVYTGTKNISAGAFVPATQLDTSKFSYNPLTGTNYDYAFDAIYQLGHAIKKENQANNVERELYVLFMSDGAPNQYNYYHAIGGDSDTSGSANWNKWLQGTMTEAERKAGAGGLLQSRTHAYYFDTEDHDDDGYINEHRMANAIKGNPEDSFEVIRKSTAGLTDLLPQTNANNLYTLPGLGATMYAIAFDISNDGKITKDSVTHVLKQIPSSMDYYYEASEEGKLVAAFKEIGATFAYAATDAYYVDQVGSSFNLQMNPSIKTNNPDNEGGYTTTTTDITITTHAIYTREQEGTKVDGHVVTKEDIGKTYGSGKLIERVTFTVNNGTITATTNVGGYKLPNSTVEVTPLETNILIDGIIYGKNFYYNSNTTSKQITLANGSTVDLPAETFYWNIGTINEVQYTMAYTVYLDGSLEGRVTAGSYDTNNYATLYYTNWVGNDVNQSVASPALAWKGAQVSYAFYLVNDDGKPVYADGTDADNFLNAYKITQPVVYKNVELNKTGGTTLNAAALAVLPQGYELYAPTAEYVVTIASGDGDGANINGWTITGDTNKTTYVVGYGTTNDYNNTQIVTTDHTDTKNYKEEYGSYDYTHTTVYFAVKWIIGTVPDTVVIDYGLDVEVNVLANDMFGSDGTLAGVGALESKPEGHGNNMAAGFGSSLADSVGTATVVGNKVRYSLKKDNSMKLNDAKTLAYAVDYDGSTNPGYYYGDLTIIPATTVYYEDEYVTLTTFNRQDTTTTDYTQTPGWPVDSVDATAIQGEDRPGQFNLSTIDANNIYGYDAAYDNMSTFSMDHAAMIHVDEKQYGTAEFEFWGTGFDVVSATSNETGTLVVQVYKANEDGSYSTTATVSKAVDTYYGYVYGFYNVVYEKGTDGLWTKVSVGDVPEEGTKEQTKADLPTNAKPGDTATIAHYTWKAVTNTPNEALYQVPVMKVDKLTYGQYKVKISALYYSTFDSTTEPGYDLYLDAIRIYNPAGTTDEELGTTIQKAYEADGEYQPSYFELRNLLIKAATVKNLSNSAVADGIVFIDGNTALADGTAILESAVEDYTNYGPNNELYLAPGQAVAFELYTPSKDGYDTMVRIGMKTVGDKTAKAELWNVGTKTVDGKVEYVKYNTISKTLNTATDMYYDISVLNNGNIVITNTGEEGSVLSITNIKTSYRPIETSTVGLSDTLPVANVEGRSVFSVTRSSVDAALMTLARPQVEEPDVEQPEGDEPEVEPEQFTPDKFEVSLNKKDVKAGQKVKVTVKTSQDVSYITVNGQEITKSKIDKKTGEKTWTVDVTADQAGEMVIEVVVYDENDVASETKSEMITVKKDKKPAPGKKEDKKPGSGKKAK